MVADWLCNLVPRQNASWKNLVKHPGIRLVAVSISEMIYTSKSNNLFTIYSDGFIQ